MTGEEIKEEKEEGYKILFVEDDASIRLLMKFIFKKTDYSFEMAENGAIGFEMYKKNNYDLVLMDIHMPVMDGLEATREIRKWEKESGGKRVPVIALTANGMVRDKQESEKAGCDGHLVKPILKKELLAIVKKYLGT